MKLFAIEWLKIKNYRTFWILIGLFVLLSGLVNYASMQMTEGFQVNSANLLSQSFAFPAAWDFVAYTQSWFVLFLVFFCIISISNEFTFRTNRQHIIDGMSRLDFLHSKFLLIGFLSLLSVILFIIITLIVGFTHGGGNVVLHSEKIILLFVYTFNYCALGAFIAFFVRKTGLAIIFLAYILFEGIIGSAINARLHTQLGNLLPLQSSDELLPSSTLAKLSEMAGLQSSPLSVWIFFIATLAYITLYYFLLRHKMLNSDL
jgi:ABC-2 type transport system permease protein